MFVRVQALALCLLCGMVFSVSNEVIADAQTGLPTAEPESVGMSSAKLAEIQSKLGPFVDNGQLPGFVTVVARDGKVVHFEAFGKMDVERDKPMQKDTIFRMYSMTKPVTGVAVMILVDEGKINVSDPVSKYIPGFAEMKVLEIAEDGSTAQVPADKPVTIEHLLTHTGGLIYGFGGDGPLSKIYLELGINSDGASGDTLEEFAAKVSQAPLDAHPGTEWNYGVSMDVLGRVVEVASGQRFGDFLHDRLFEPLGMKDSGFYVPVENAERFAANYGPNKETGGMILIDDPETSQYLNVPSLDSGGGGMVGTAADYLRFAQMLVNEGELDGVRILSARSVHEMTTDQLAPELGDTPLSLLSLPLRGVGFGYTGAVVRRGFTETVFGGAGEFTWGGAASTDFWIDKTEKLVGISLTQLLPTGTYPQRLVMHNAVYAAIIESYGSENTD